MADARLSEVFQLQARGDLTGAAEVCRRVLAETPSDAQAVHAMGLLHHQLGRHAEAAGWIGRAIELSPRVAVFHCNLAAVLGAMGRHGEAAGALAKAIGLDPRQPVAHYNLGMALETLGRLAEAQAAYERATALDPKYAAAWAGLGEVLAKLGQMAQAEGSLRRAIELDPKQPQALHELARVSFLLGNVEQAIAHLRAYIQLAPNDVEAHSGLLYRLHYLPGVSWEQMFQEHLAWARRHAEPLRSAWRPHENDRSSGRRLKVGYVSPDFRRHSVATFFEPLLSNHDRQRFEITLYSSTPQGDDVTQRLRSKADRFVDIARVNDEQAAQRIRQDRIDILVDLTGHMAGHRLLLFARKPAPIQVTYVGHPDTTGMTAIDYRLTDSNLDPPGGGSDAFHTEKLIRLPTVFGCYQPPEEDLPVLPLPAGADGPITFGCLNLPGKITPQVAALWCEILKRLPQSRLVLSINPGAVASREMFARCGLDPHDTRLQWAGRMTRLDYLSAFHRIDIALDPFPYNGQTTTCDAMWMGVPVVALQGDSYVSRMGANLLHQVGLPELVAQSPSQYVPIATSLAADRARLAALRHSMRNRLQSSPLMNPAALAQDLEQAFRLMWQRYGAAR